MAYTLLTNVLPKRHIRGGVGILGIGLVLVVIPNAKGGIRRPLNCCHERAHCIEYIQKRTFEIRPYSVSNARESMQFGGFLNATIASE